MTGQRLQRYAPVGWTILAGLLWFGTTGIISSNDGSHLALGRALVVRGETTIDPEVALTLWVDRAKRDGHQYSDRPPGTALLAAPAIAVGNRLDASFLRRSLERREPVFTPAAPAYLEVYSTRPAKVGVRAVPILAYQGSAAALSLHTVLVGLVGLWCVAWLLARNAVGPAGRAFAVATLGLATLWGPYATTLFSHVTAGTFVVLGLVALSGLRETQSPRRRAGLAAAAGLCGAWAAASDYLVVALVVGSFAVAIDWRQNGRELARVLLWGAVGAAPIIAATLAYHDAAFGSPWSIGYDHHANFEFARDRGATFSGNPVSGLWTLWGLGEGAGVLALSPVALFGVVGLAMSPWRRTALAALPWVLVLSLHKTPAGGGSVDHRYLVPLLPLLGLGLGVIWQRLVTDGRQRRAVIGAGLVAVAVASGFLSWGHFAQTRG